MGIMRNLSFPRREDVICSAAGSSGEWMKGPPARRLYRLGLSTNDVFVTEEDQAGPGRTKLLRAPHHAAPTRYPCLQSSRRITR